MTKSRLEAFSDGVLAVIITIMVLEIKIPHGSDLAALTPLIPNFLSYVLSFVYVGIYWNNHHHMMLASRFINGRVMWSNLYLLFWLSLVPVVSGWVGENPKASWPAAVYGFVLLMSGIAWLVLTRALIARNPGSVLAQAIGRQRKGKISAVLYSVGLGFAFVEPIVSQVIYALVAALWVIPDRGIEAKIEKLADGEAE